jgi:hypothetical protein
MKVVKFTLSFYFCSILVGFASCGMVPFSHGKSSASFWDKPKNDNQSAEEQVCTIDHTDRIEERDVLSTENEFLKNWVSLVAGESKL